MSLNKPHSRITESGVELRLREMGKKLDVEKFPKRQSNNNNVEIQGSANANNNNNNVEYNHPGQP